ncbi:phosphatase PAP2 family protein [Cytophagales bacterium WSM2-2]|nr:phosphatase PAP2 family protein [Cytophagales bacterium WSM2-2]
MQQLIELDKKLLLFLNSFHHPALDPVMLLITQTFFWLPLYLFLIYLIFRSYGKQGWYFLIGAAVTILLADQITSSLMKPFFARLRPSQEPTLQGLVHLVDNYKGGLFGFASSHAANTFGTSLFVFLVLRPYHKWIIWIFVWAAVMTYTRIYLGVHYPGDILVGLLIGLGSGWTGYKVSQWALNRFGQKKPT